MINHKLIAVILIPVLSLLAYQSVNNTIAGVALNNAHYYLKQVAREYANSESVNNDLLKKSQAMLARAETLIRDNPNYYLLSANLLWWDNQGGRATEQTLEQAKHYYYLGLAKQPNNPFLWDGLAKTEQALLTQSSAMEAITRANYYAPSNKAILKDVVMWKLSIWGKLGTEQQTETIQQLQQLLKLKKLKRQTYQQVREILKETTYQSQVCSKLLNTKRYKQICH